MKIWAQFKRRLYFPAVKVDSDGFITTLSAGDEARTPAVEACVRLIASTLASLRWGVYREADGHLEYQAGHPLNGVLRNPNASLSADEFWRMMFRRLVLRGNAYAGLRSSGESFYLTLLDQDSVTASRAKNGVLNYRARERLYPGALQRNFRFTRRTMLHLRGPDIDMETGVACDPLVGAVGVAARFHRQAAAIMGAVTERAPGAFGLLKLNAGLTSQDKVDRAMALAKDLKEAARKGGVAALEPGLEFQKVDVGQVDQYLLGVIRWSIDEVARGFGVPLPLIHSEAGRLNAQIDEHRRSFVSTTINDWRDSIGSQLGHKLLDMTELGQGYRVWASTLQAELPGMADLAGVANTLAGTGVMTRGEIRRVMVPLNLERRADDDAMPQTRGAPQRPENNMEGDNNADDQEEQADDAV